MDVVSEDISKILSREERIDSLAAKIVDQTQDTYQFERGTKAVKNRSCTLQ